MYIYKEDVDGAIQADGVQGPRFVGTGAFAPFNFKQWVNAKGCSSS